MLRRAISSGSATPSLSIPSPLVSRPALAPLRPPTPAFRVLWILEFLLQQDFILLPHRNGVNSSCADIQTRNEDLLVPSLGQEDLAQISLDVNRQFKTAFVVHTSRVIPQRGLDMSRPAV